MSWFDKLFGEEQRNKPVIPLPENTHHEDHSEIYRRPKGKFRFPVDMGDSKHQAAQVQRHISNELVSDAYFEEKRARRKQRHSARQRATHYEHSTKQHRQASPYTETRPVYKKESIHKPRFVTSEVPSAIFGSRKHLKPSDRQVVITPLKGNEPQQVPAEVPTHRKSDNMVNIENIYASQIVAEIRREREKKARRIRESQTVDIEPEEMVEVNSIEVAEIETEIPPHDAIWIETVSADIQDNAQFNEPEELHETLELSSEIALDSIQDEPVVESSSFDKTTEASISDASEAVTSDTVSDEASQNVASESPHETILHSETEVMTQDLTAESETSDQSVDVNVAEEATQEISTAVKRKTSPFNVVMTPSDKRKLMDKNRLKNEVVNTESSTDYAANESSDSKTEINPAASESQQQSQTSSKPLPSVLQNVKRDQKRKGPNYMLPPVNLLQPMAPMLDNFEWVDEQKEQLDDAFYHFNVPAKVENVVIGPSVTRYELSVEKGVKVSRITNLQDDIKLALAAKDIRIEAPIPGTSLVGVEVPNTETRKINLSEVIFSKRFKFAESKLMVALGVKINNEPMLMDIAKMPHALIAGATGSGKSVSINAILLSLLYRNNPNELKLLLIDPKMVELAPYNDLPHLIAPVITDVKAATESLKWAVEEMERRYQMFADVHVRNITAYNQKSPYDKRLPKIVIVIDELADLMMMAPQEVEHAIARIAQKARAAGIHMILATQRPSVNVITGLIKANVPTRIAFMVSSSIDSRTVLDGGGAEKLLGNGDMLYQGNGMSKPIRVQGAYVSDNEIDTVVEYIKSQAGPNYLFGENDLLEKVNEIPQDDLFDEVVEMMKEEGQISTSQVQRRFQIGYNRAARIIDSLEALGYISGPNGSKPRKVLLTDKF